MIIYNYISLIIYLIEDIGLWFVVMNCYLRLMNSRRFTSRIIVSLIDGPLYALAAFLHKIISSNIPLTASQFNNIVLINKLNDIH